MVVVVFLSLLICFGFHSGVWNLLLEFARPALDYMLWSFVRQTVGEFAKVLCALCAHTSSCYSTSRPTFSMNVFNVNRLRGFTKADETCSHLEGCPPMKIISNCEEVID